MRRTAGVLLLALLAWSCGAQTASESPASSPTATTAPTAALSPSPTEVAPSPTEAPSSTTPPAPTAFDVTWKAADLSGIGNVETITGVAKAGDTYVLVASLPYLEDTSPNNAAWWSTEGLAWTPAFTFPPSDRIHAVVAGGPGFVAAGANDNGGAVWTSTDGRSWQPVTDSSLDGGVISQLVPTASGIVGFGWRSDSDVGAIWTSADGLEWLAATNDSGMTVARGLEAVSSYDGRAIAFVNEGEKDPPSIWETTGRAEWTQTGTLPNVAAIERVAGGARGWLALGGNKAWTSADGTTWGKGVPGPDVSADAIVDDAGYVAVGSVGSLPGETCGDQRPFAGHTWTSGDGTTWQRMPVTKEFKQALISKLLVVDRTLLGYGQRVVGDDGSNLPAAAWTDELPEVTKAGDASDKASVPKFCGG